MEDGGISDDRITASSTWVDNPDHGPSNARLNRPETPPTTGAWTAKTNNLSQWIQADLSGSIGGLKWISGVDTQGRNGGYRGENTTQWVTKFKVSYSDNGETWSFAKDKGQNVRKQTLLQLILSKINHYYCIKMNCSNL